MVAASYAASGYSLYYYPHLSNAPKLVVGPLPPADHFLLSPDNRLVAVEHSGDAVHKARLEIVSTDTGKVKHAFELDADGVSAAMWAPDSTSVLAGARSAAGAYTWAMYEADGTSHALNGFSQAQSVKTVLWIQGAGGITAWDHLCPNCGDGAQQLMKSSGSPVVVDWFFGPNPGTNRFFDIRWGVYDPTTDAIAPFDGVYGSDVRIDREGALGCGRFAVISLSSATGPSPGGIFDADSGKIIPLEFTTASAACPVASNNGRLVAIQSTDGVRVVDLATGVQTAVAREGHPIAWSKDDKKVVVEGNGTFSVAADGSGGAPASATLQSHCTVGKTGTLITSAAATASGGSLLSTVDMVAYDPSADSASQLGKGQLVVGASCAVSSDGKWMLTNNTLVDLVGGHASLINVTSRNQARVNLALAIRGPASINTIERKLP